jgi:hypothetical protein
MDEGRHLRSTGTLLTDVLTDARPRYALIHCAGIA